MDRGLCDDLSRRDLNLITLALRPHVDRIAGSVSTQRL